jgi:hypothetical protein
MQRSKAYFLLLVGVLVARCCFAKERDVLLRNEQLWEKLEDSHRRLVDERLSILIEHDTFNEEVDLGYRESVRMCIYPVCPVRPTRRSEREQRPALPHKDERTSNSSALAVILRECVEYSPAQTHVFLLPEECAGSNRERVQVNWIDIWGPTYTCQNIEHLGIVGDGGKWTCGVHTMLQRCAPG